MNATVAVVEDDVRILDALELVLAAEGWAVKTYTMGEAFLTDLANNGAPQCLILDPHLPGIDGAEVAYSVTSRHRYPDIPIIVLTARPTSTVTQQIIEAGARAMLTKPVAAEELINQVYAAIHS